MGEIIRLKAGDGHEFSAYHVAATGPIARRAGLVVVQEIFGVNEHIGAVCDGYGKQGYEVYSPALFDRIEPDIELGYEESDVARGIELRGALKDSEVLLDVEACVKEKGGDAKIGVIGYCFGGFVSWISSCELVHVSAAVCYYGGGIVAQLDIPPRCPVMMHFGALDSMIPLSDIDKIRAAQADVEIHIYDSADHGFNCDHRSSFQKMAASTALDRTLTFLSSHIG